MALPLPPNDEALVLALRGGRAGAGLALFDRYARSVERVVARVLGPDPDIPDIVQDVFTTAIATLHRLKDGNALRPWLTSMAVFKARTLLRNRRRWRFVESMPFDFLPEREASTAPPEAGQALRSTYAVLERLPTDERIAFALRYIDGMGLQEAAAACDVSLSTFKRRVQRAHTTFVAAARGNPVLREWLAEDAS